MVWREWSLSGLGTLRGILGQVTLVEELPGTSPNVSEGSGFSCELHSLPTKEEQTGLLEKGKPEISLRQKF